MSVGGRHEAHHGGFTDDRRQLWMGGLDDSRRSSSSTWRRDPAQPKLVKTIDDFVAKSGGVVGPHTFYALARPHADQRALEREGRRRQDRARRVQQRRASTCARSGCPTAREYGYDVRVNANLNRMLTSSFTGKNNYMRPLGELMGDAEAMKKFGNTMVVWDFHTRKPLQTLAGAGRAARDPLGAAARATTTPSPPRALTGKLWGVFRKDDGSFEAVELAPIGDPARARRCRSTSALRRRQLPLRRQLHGRHGARVRRVESAQAESSSHEQQDRQAAQHGVADLGREARLLHVVAARELGQGRRRRRAVPARVRLGRQGARAALRGRLHRREARPAAHHELR